MKKCSKCKQLLNLELYCKDKNRSDGFYPTCKICRKEFNVKNKEARRIKDKIYYNNNQEKILNSKKEYYNKNKTELLQKNRIYLKNNPDKVKKYAKKTYLKNFEKKQKYQKNNREHINKKRKELYHNNPKFKIASLLRNRVVEVLKEKNFKKNNKFIKYIDCTVEFLVNYLESKFKPGMSWDNHGDWHIDHKIPLASAKTEQDVYKLSHYTNLQPLWSKENLTKSNKILEVSNF